MEEKRKEQRYLVGLRSITVHSPFAQKSCGNVEDLSLSGISFSADMYFPNGSEPNLLLKTSTLKDPVPIKVHTIWNRGSVTPNQYIYGALIVSIDPESKLTILKLLSQDWKESIPTDGVEKISTDPQDEATFFDPLQ